MKLTITIITTFCTILTMTSDVSMLNIKIGDTESSLKKIKLDVVAEETGMIKFRTNDGNDFSVTSENGKIVYLENDWLQNPKSITPLISKFKFGQTSLKEIRKIFGTNGFCYKSRGAFTTETDIIEFNCFEIDSDKNEILVLITKAPLNANATEDNIAERLKLDAVIISTKKYLDDNWGEEKAFDTNYKKVHL